MFRHLRTKLTVLYAGLFAAILALLAALALAEVSSDAQRMVRKELATSSLVFERLWAQRAAQLETDALVLARDFGFRSAVATHDVPTVRSALDNLKTRLGVERAMLIGPDGTIVSAEAGDGPLNGATIRALQGDDVASGVLVLDEQPYEAISTPIAPGLNAGWVVFAQKLDARQMASLESMAAIPLTAQVAYRGRAGGWRQTAGLAGPNLAAFLDAALSHPRAPPATLKGQDGTAVAAATPLASLEAGRPAILVLQYPMDKALAPYRLLLGLMVGTGLLGFVALLLGTWGLARSVTRPISSLEEAAKRLQHGERARVEVQTQDEIGRLADTFNTMAAEINQREHELATARDLAEAANRAKSTFLANMSHEVRTPLNGVIGVAGILAAGRLKADQRHMVGIIQSSAAVLQRVLDDVLDLARVEAGRLEIIDDDFDLGEAVRTLAEASAVQCQAKGLRFALQMDKGCSSAMVRGDRVRLEQILGNLLSNAVKFTEHGDVSLAVTTEPSTFRFEVSDTGVGFDPALTDQLFQPFQQADGSMTRKFGGTGLGLSISRELARAMGGDLAATSAPGQGASFVLTAPLIPIAAAPRPAAPAAAERRPAQGSSAAAMRVLVVDDHETNRTVARLILEGVGAKVVCVEDGAQAVSAVEADAFDVVFMDMQMPVMDGLTAIRTIREGERAYDKVRTPILMLSANALPEHVAAAHDAGADGHIAKPITPPRLIAALEQALTLAAEPQTKVQATA